MVGLQNWSTIYCYFHLLDSEHSELIFHRRIFLPRSRRRQEMTNFTGKQ
jgi:hypothetical protein